MRLDEISGEISGLALRGDAGTSISGLADDSRKVVKGDLFFALSGRKNDGNDYIRSALERGASAVATDRPVPAELAEAFPGAAWLSAPDILKAFSKAAAAFNGHPSRLFTLIGVTGTKGKTTAAYILENIYRLAGAAPGLIGTINHRAGGKILAKASNTTPPAHELHALFRTMASAGASAVVMEVSSHALALSRADEAAFDAAVFTNLQRDHLDFHGDRENYFRAKLKLFELLADSPKKKKSAVINSDDEKAGEILKNLRTGITPVTYGLTGPADFRAEKIELRSDLAIFELNARGIRVRTTLRLPGRYNISNALAAIAAAVSCGVPLERGLKRSRASRAAWNGWTAASPSAYSWTTRTPTPRLRTCLPASRRLRTRK
jgi:UDP-N-acetylmuramoyl-L-alanyl-D-glutamate--2,6-diaminopimelate ligase